MAPSGIVYLLLSLGLSVIEGEKRVNLISLPEGEIMIIKKKSGAALLWSPVPKSDF